MPTPPSGELVRQFVELSLGTARLRFRGSAGQSFSPSRSAASSSTSRAKRTTTAWEGTLRSGDRSEAVPPRRHASPAGAQTILLNPTLYGATSGRLFAASRAGDRFAERNSNVVAVGEWEAARDAYREAFDKEVTPEALSAANAICC